MVMEQVLLKVFGTYGNKQDLFELAVLKKIKNNNYDLCYKTSITDNVLGGLTNEEVLETLEKIKNLTEEDEINNREEYEDQEVEEFNSFEKFKKYMGQILDEHIINENKKFVDEINKQIQPMINMRDMLNEIGTDMIDISEMIDYFIDYFKDPLLFLNDNVVEESDKMINEIRMRVLVMTNKMEAFNNLMSDSEEGEK